MTFSLECPHVDAAIAASFDRVYAEYHELPGLSLTQAQMRRLFAFDASVCERVIDALVTSHVLRRTPSGRYVADWLFHQSPMEEQAVSFHRGAIARRSDSRLVSIPTL